MSSKKFDLVVFGATAVTGKATIQYLLSHPQKSTFKWAIAGRSKARLDALRKEYKIPEDVPTIIADAFDADAIAKMVSQTKAVLNESGPYNTMNARGIIAECIKQGTAYTDLTGESGYYKKVVDEFHEAATKACVPIVPSSGFDSVPFDLGVFLAVQHLKSQTPAANITTVTTAVRGSGPVGKGTLMSAVDMMERPRGAKEDTAWQLRSVRADEFNPLAAKHKMPWGPVMHAPPGTNAGALAFSPLSCHDHRVVNRTWGLLKQSRPKEAYGEQFQYVEGFAAPNAFVAFLVSIMVKTFLFIQLWFPPARLAIKRLPDGFVVDPRGRLSKNAFFETRTVARSEAGESSLVRMYGKFDPAFAATIRFQVEATLALVQDADSRLLKGGVLTPAMLGHRYAERLVQNAKMNIEVSSVDEKKRQ